MEQLLHFFHATPEACGSQLDEATDWPQRSAGGAASAADMSELSGGSGVSGGVTASVLLSEQRLDESDDEIYFNVTILRDSEEATQLQPQHSRTHSSSAPQHVAESTAPSRTATARPSIAAAAATSRKRKVAETERGSVTASRVARGVGVERGVTAAMGAASKRARTSSSTKLKRAPSQSDQRRPPPPCDSVATLKQTAQTGRDSTASRRTAASPFLPSFSAGTVASSSLRAPSVSCGGELCPAGPMSTSSVAPVSSAYTSMLAELDERVAASRGGGEQPTTAPQTSRTASVATPSAARSSHSNKAGKSATSEQRSSRHSSNAFLHRHSTAQPDWVSPSNLSPHSLCWLCSACRCVALPCSASNATTGCTSSSRAKPSPSSSTTVSRRSTRAAPTAPRCHAIH